MRIYQTITAFYEWAFFYAFQLYLVPCISRKIHVFLVFLVLYVLISDIYNNLFLWQLGLETYKFKYVRITLLEEIFISMTFPNFKLKLPQFSLFYC